MSRTSRTPPNIILLVLDALRRDAIEPYGAPPGSSPALAALARRGRAVSDVRSTASWTLPAHVAMFTGELARGLGLGQAPRETPQSAAPTVRALRDRLLAEVLRRAGYVTRGVTTNVWAGKQAGFDVGFDEFVELDSSRQNVLGGGLRNRVKWDLEGMRGRADDGAAKVEPVMRSWIKKRDARPFFTFLNLVECHSPYLPPNPYNQMTPLNRFLAADEAHRYLTLDAIMRSWAGVLSVPGSALNRMRRLYARSVRYADDWLGRMLETLAESHLLDETLVIVCSDHGENLGEGSLITHGGSLDDRLLRVPFIVAGPGAEAFLGMVSLAELPARIAAAVGLPDHSWGKGLPAGLPVAQWDGFVVSEDRIMEVAQRWQVADETVRRLTLSLTCAVSGALKLARGVNGTDEVLYDLATDPLEVAPITEENAKLARAREALAHLRRAVNHPDVQARGVAVPSSEALPADEVADIERRMRLMGYM